MSNETFRLDRPTAMYNAGIWVILSGLLVTAGFIVGGWQPTVGLVVGALGALALLVGVALVLRPPWVVELGEHLTVRGRQRHDLPWDAIRDVRWVDGRLVVRTDADQVKLPAVDRPSLLAARLKERLGETWPQ